MDSAGQMIGAKALNSTSQYASGEKPALPMSEIDRETHRLLARAEELELCVSQLLVRTETVTRQESSGKGEAPTPAAPVPATQLARNLDAICGRLSGSISVLQSLNQRIEL